MPPSTTTAEDTQVLKLTLGPDGEVWYLDGDRLPCRTGLGWDEFAAGPVRRNAEQVRVVGVPANASLITSLYELKLKDELASVAVCSPLVCSAAADRTDPEKVLFNMRRWNIAGTIGGWHEVVRADYVAYAMVALARGGASMDRLMAFLPEHPAARPLSFACHDAVALVNLLVQVVDPRWFVDLDVPDRPAKLQAFLGLDPQVERYGARRPAQRGRNRDVRSAWMSGPEIEQAGGYFKRFRAELVAGGESEWKADLRTGQRFAVFMRQVWLDALYPMPNGWGEPLFVPGHFFRRRAEEMAFAAHTGRRHQD